MTVKNTSQRRFDMEKTGFISPPEQMAITKVGAIKALGVNAV
jgi:hypothetical protein